MARRNNRLVTYQTSEGETRATIGISRYYGIADNDLYPIRQVFYENNGIFPSSDYINNIDGKCVLDYLKKHEILYWGNSEERLDAMFRITKYIYIYLYYPSYNKKESNTAAYVWTHYKIGDHNYQKVVKIIKEYKKQDNKKDNNQICILTNDKHTGLRTKYYPINKIDLDLKTHYNDGLIEIHEQILDSLKKKKSELYLFQGLPGTGKTTYIRHLISLIDGVEKIFIPPGMVNVLTTPEFMQLCLNHAGSIFIIEDAEEAIIKRGDGLKNAAVANILNMTDGLLGDVLNIKIIATANTEINNIDEAILRKGRLKFRYEFTPLTIEKTKTLANMLGVEISGERTLAEIYNSKQADYVNKKRKIGF